MFFKRFILSLSSMVVLVASLQAQTTPQTYFSTEQLPDLIQALPAPPDTLSAAFTYDIMRYMWGKTQRLDPVRFGATRRCWLSSMFLSA